MLTATAKASSRTSSRNSSRESSRNGSTTPTTEHKGKSKKKRPTKEAVSSTSPRDVIEPTAGMLGPLGSISEKMAEMSTEAGSFLQEALAPFKTPAMQRAEEAPVVKDLAATKESITALFAPAAAAPATAAATSAAVDIADAPAPIAPLTLAEVEACQAGWADAIVAISAAHKAGGDFVGVAAAAAGELYGYGHGTVLFKPTKATEHPFRPTGAEAMSYFVGHGAVEGGYKEDGGFAINGGKGWSKVAFHNHQVQLHNELAHAMGSYVFTCLTTGEETRVEYTFGYKRCADGKVRICLHHSSVPYTP